MSKDELKIAIAKALDEKRYADADVLQKELDALDVTTTDESLLPVEALAIQASDGVEGWNPPDIMDYTTIKLVRYISKRKRGSEKDDFRMELKYSDKITLKMFLSTLKRLWLDAGQAESTLLIAKGVGFTLNEKVQIKWEKNKDDDNKKFPFRAKARHA